MKTPVFILSMLFAGGVTNAQNTTSGGAHGSGPGVVLRQGNPNTPNRVQSSATRLASLLALNDTQRAKLQAILNEQHAKMEEFVREEEKNSGHNPSAEEIHATQDQLQRESMDEFRAILTDSQLQKLNELGEVDLG